MFLPAARGFDEYLGIPYSDDMGAGRVTPCHKKDSALEPSRYEEYQKEGDKEAWSQYEAQGFAGKFQDQRTVSSTPSPILILTLTSKDQFRGGDKAGDFLPLVHQHGGKGTTHRHVARVRRKSILLLCCHPLLLWESRAAHRLLR